MKSNAVHFWVMVALLVAGGAVINVWAASGEASAPRRPLAEFPAEVGGWRQRGGDARFDAATEAVLRANDYVSRDYVSADGAVPASLYVGYYATQRTGATYHSPLNCLPGSGWTLNEPGRVEIKPADGSPAFEANRYVIEHAGDRHLMIYWYQGRGRAVASEYVDKVYTVFDSIRRRRSDGSMVRVLVPVRGSEKDALERATQFASQVEPKLSAYVPD
ncbi:MAG TPA: EpsI family protein [Pyrinomonadaceae bacterium]|jgi:EpsI family protein|nr:EpsI family protein [Pyrinomonadaceae bacterium]